MNGERRSVAEIRSSLTETKGRLTHDLEELDQRIHNELSPRAILSRHPALFGIAGAVLGYVLIRRPALLARGLARAAQAGAPFLVRALLKKN
jgi:hypothetical protein